MLKKRVVKQILTNSDASNFCPECSDEHPDKVDLVGSASSFSKSILAKKWGHGIHTLQFPLRLYKFVVAVIMNCVACHLSATLVVHRIVERGCDNEFS